MGIDDIVIQLDLQIGPNPNHIRASDDSGTVVPDAREIAGERRSAESITPVSRRAFNKLIR